MFKVSFFLSSLALICVNSKSLEDSRPYELDLKLNVIVDKIALDLLDGDVEKAEQLVKDSIDHANELYKEANILISLENFMTADNDESNFEISENAVPTLLSFFNYTNSEYWKSFFFNKINFLLSGYENVLTSNAVPSRKCTEVSAALIYGNGIMNPKDIGNRIAHEIGHILNLSHDFKCGTCIMSQAQNFDHPWSERMKYELKEYLENDPRCLKEVR